MLIQERSTSSVLGYTYRDRFPTLVELIAEDGRINDLMSYITTPATERISELKQAPNNFYELVFETEAKHFMKILPGSKQVKGNDWLDFTGKNFKLKMPFKIASIGLQMIVGEGIGFGYKYPDLTEKFLSYKYDKAAKTEWKKAFNHGLDIGHEPPENKPLPILQLDAKNLIMPFIEKVHPELLDTLGLNDL